MFIRHLLFCSLGLDTRPLRQKYLRRNLFGKTSSAKPLRQNLFGKALRQNLFGKTSSAKSQEQDPFLQKLSSTPRSLEELRGSLLIADTAGYWGSLWLSRGYLWGSEHTMKSPDIVSLNVTSYYPCSLSCPQESPPDPSPPPSLNKASFIMPH